MSNPVVDGRITVKYVAGDWDQSCTGPILHVQSLRPGGTDVGLVSAFLFHDEVSAGVD